jgi:deoxyribodipyrimidine photo-lyase
MRGLMWFKKDLRLRDNPALYHAAKECSEGLAAIYIIDLDMFKKNSMSHCQINFIVNGLQELAHELKKINVSLVVKITKDTKNVPAIILTLMQEIRATKIFFNKELEYNEIKREIDVVNYLTKNNIEAATYDEQLILPYDKLHNKQGEYYKIFTAFKHNWINVFQNEKIKTLTMPQKVRALSRVSDIPQKVNEVISLVDPTLWPAGELQAQKTLAHFLKDKLFHYAEQRDFPSLSGTSQLSPYLATGMISARDCFLSALQENQFELNSGNKGALVWMSELIWREFYRYILIAVPRICKNEAYKVETEQLPWVYDKKLLHAWQKGITGFPLVDAAMRQLNATGWMHNRLRMVVAMFLSKNLFLDWRLGERYFAENLIDYDFASNNGGWQWSASTGTDAVPYFRIFNPITQSERFDPEGTFIRAYCPELSMLTNREIHDPHAKALNKISPKIYPLPIIDYKKSRARAIFLFKQLR